MLVVTRSDKFKENQIQVIIDGKVVAVVTIVSIRGERVRIGLEADKNVKFMRTDAIKKYQDDGVAPES